jgi:hypothetical protein
MKTPIKNNQPDLFIGPSVITKKELLKVDSLIRSLKKQNRNAASPRA